MTKSLQKFLPSFFQKAAKKVRGIKKGDCAVLGKKQRGSQPLTVVVETPIHIMGLYLNCTMIILHFVQKVNDLSQHIVKFTYKTKKRTERTEFSPFFVYFSQFLKIPFWSAGIIELLTRASISSSLIFSKMALRPTKLEMPMRM